MRATPIATPGERPLRVAYVLKRFPRLSETFVLNELLELERQGVEVEVFSLLRPPEEARHAALASLRARVTYLPSSRALAEWRVGELWPAEQGADGALAPRKAALADLVAGDAGLGAELFPGRAPHEVAHLVAQATALALLARSRGVEHLHAHFASNATAVALLASRLSGITYSFTAHARDIYHTYVDAETDDAVRRRKIAESAFLVTVSEYNRRYLAELAGAQHAPKVRRLYNGIDLGLFEPRDAPVREPLVLAVGRLVEKKGLRHLVEACALLRARGIDAPCVIVGDGPERDQLSAMIRELGLEGSVRIDPPMPQERLVRQMREASVLALPAVVSASGDRDGLPTVLLEALALGVPAISTRVAGIPEIIEDGRTGLLAEPGDAAGLADAIARVLCDDALAARLAREGLHRARERFDLRTNVGTLRAMFARACRASEPVAEPTSTEEIAHAHRLRVG
ncbi:MAG: glycosyltransferase [Ectothiorhodospiraceae bacterium]|nr:glycosyltransferase [Chromatiales bacterium]MCP5153693.1 glycosyltransferase [Ectothiorhodospiraceae bacterium]